MDHTSPIKYEGTGEIPSAGLFDTIDSWDIHCEYANGVPMHFMCTRVAKDVVGKMDQRKRPFSLSCENSEGVSCSPQGPRDGSYTAC